MQDTLSLEKQDRLLLGQEICSSPFRLLEYVPLLLLPSSFSSWKKLFFKRTILFLQKDILVEDFPSALGEQELLLEEADFLLDLLEEEELSPSGRRAFSSGILIEDKDYPWERPQSAILT